MTWCERCVADHDGPCIDEFARREVSEALEGYRHSGFGRSRKRARAKPSRGFTTRQNAAGPGAGGSKGRSRHRRSPEADWLDLHYDVMNRLT